jgi:hypothetical protein
MIVSFINSFENGKLNYKSVAFFFAIISFIFLIPSLLEFSLLAKLKVSEKMIENQTILFNKTTIIPYSEIKSMELQTERSDSDRGYINDGYPVSVLNLKNGSKLIISSDCYENYNELMVNIRIAYKKHEA